MNAEGAGIAPGAFCFAAGAKLLGSQRRPLAVLMTVYAWAIFACWLLFAIFWAVKAPSAKRTIGGWRAWRRWIGARLVIIIVVIIAVHLWSVFPTLRISRSHVMVTSAAAGATGAVLCALGVALAIMARAQLGRNWGMPMAEKENPELVTTGPYAVIRHPIYAGMLLALLGTAIGLIVFALAPFVIGLGYFLYSARCEERDLIKAFPDQYPAYRQRTWMFLPLVL